MFKAYINSLGIGQKTKKQTTGVKVIYLMYLNLYHQAKDS